MKIGSDIAYIGVFGLIIGLVLLAGMYLIPWRTMNWGNISVAPSLSVTVTGSAKSQVENQVASFTAGINVVNDSKDTAISEANKKIEAIIAAIKEFGVKSSDIKTQNLNVFQQEETYYDNGVQKQRAGQWRVNNTIEITLRDISQASDLTQILTASGANNIYGPNFTVDDTLQSETALLGKAIDNARTKATEIARASGRKLGPILNVTEGIQSVNPVYSYAKGMGGGGGMPTEPGSATIEKSVTVTFELK